MDTTVMAFGLCGFMVAVALWNFDEGAWIAGVLALAIAALFGFWGIAAITSPDTLAGR